MDDLNDRHHWLMQYDDVYAGRLSVELSGRSNGGAFKPLPKHECGYPRTGRQICWFCKKERVMKGTSFDWSTDRCREAAESCECHAQQQNYYPPHVIAAWQKRAELLRQAEAVMIEVPDTAGAPY